MVKVPALSFGSGTFGGNGPLASRRRRRSTLRENQGAAQRRADLQQNGAANGRRDARLSRIGAKGVENQDVTPATRMTVASSTRRHGAPYGLEEASQRSRLLRSRLGEQSEHLFCVPCSADGIDPFRRRAAAARSRRECRHSAPTWATPEGRRYRPGHRQPPRRGQCMPFAAVQNVQHHQADGVSL